MGLILSIIGVSVDLMYYEQLTFMLNSHYFLALQHQSILGRFPVTLAGKVELKKA